MLEVGQGHGAKKWAAGGSVEVGTGGTVVDGCEGIESVD